MICNQTICDARILFAELQIRYCDKHTSRQNVHLESELLEKNLPQVDVVAIKWLSPEGVRILSEESR